MTDGPVTLRAIYATMFWVLELTQSPMKSDGCQKSVYIRSRAFLHQNNKGIVESTIRFVVFVAFYLTFGTGHLTGGENKSPHPFFADSEKFVYCLLQQGYSPYRDALSDSTGEHSVGSS